MSWKHFLYMNYWFTQPDTARYSIALIWWIIFAVLIVIGIVCSFLAKRGAFKLSPRALHSFASLGVTMGLLGALFFYFRQKQAYFFAWRFWFLIWFVGLLVWLGTILWHVFRRVTASAEEKKEELLRTQYLPKSKA